MGTYNPEHDPGVHVRRRDGTGDKYFEKRTVSLVLDFRKAGAVVNKRMRKKKKRLNVIFSQKKKERKQQQTNKRTIVTQNSSVRLPFNIILAISHIHLCGRGMENVLQVG